MAEQGDIEGLEPTLNAEAGLTVTSAQAAGSHGFVDDALHAGNMSTCRLCRLLEPANKIPTFISAVQVLYPNRPLCLPLSAPKAPT